GAQVLYQRGPFELETEYFQQKYDAIQGGAADGEKPEFTGGYVNAGVFLTGESRAYDPRLNVFGPPTPARPLSQGGAGAWQLVANYSTLELSDQSITGGQIDMAALGINWYPEQRLRFTLEYGSVLKVDGGPNDGDEPSFGQARAQVEWYTGHGSTNRSGPLTWPARSPDRAGRGTTGACTQLPPNRCVMYYIKRAFWLLCQMGTKLPITRNKYIFF